MRVLLVMFVSVLTTLLSGCMWCYDGGGFICTEFIPPPPPYPYYYVPPHQTIILRNDVHWTEPRCHSPHHHGPYRH